MRLFILHQLIATVSLVFAQSTTSNINEGDMDQFTYGQTIQTSDGSPNNIYGPEEWINVRCTDLEQCQGWPEKFEQGIGWSLEENSCEWCPPGNNSCHLHHQSPINMQRRVAIPGDPEQNDCIDIHWMAYFNSDCGLDQLKKYNAFTIERYALKITQPVEALGNDTYQTACVNNGQRRWGKIDFSKGYSDWWYLSHADFHVPSEHTQEGKRYSGEIHLYHFYSVSGEVAGVHNEMGTVTFFLEAYDDTADWDVLNQIICQWRRAEDHTRRSCGLPSVKTVYPGCFPYARTNPNFPFLNSSTTPPVSPANWEGTNRKLRGQQSKPNTIKKPLSAFDIIHQNSIHKMNESYQPKVILTNDDDDRLEGNFDWESFIAEQIEQEEKRKGHRHLMDYEHVGPWFNYFPMLAVKTEYYYRYSGSQTIPPCYGFFRQNNDRRWTNAWRVMKDPIRVSHRQINEMHRLLKDRIAPADDPIRPCEPDTAAAPDPVDPNKVSVARPLQENTKEHYVTFCECRWRSKWAEDRQHCEIKDIQKRLYGQPYNFKTNGF